MDSFWLRNREGLPITDWEGWVRPKEDYQWKRGRSAMELARAWFPKGKLACPAELDSLLQSSPRTAGYQLTIGQPEFVTQLPERGEGRNHDLWLQGHCPAGNLTICIEAKADEPFGNLIYEEIARARKRKATTRLPARVEALLQLLFGHPCNPLEKPWSHLRYQLITALAGTVIQADHDGSTTAVFVVHEFLSGALDSERLRQNDVDLNAVLAFRVPGCDAIKASNFVGPIHIAGCRDLPCSVDLLVGKVQARLPSNSA